MLFEIPAAHVNAQQRRVERPQILQRRSGKQNHVRRLAFVDAARLAEHAAELGGFADRTGSVTVGKDADLILLDGDPFEIMTNVCMTMINGKIVFERI